MVSVLSPSTDILLIPVHFVATRDDFFGGRSALHLGCGISLDGSIRNYRSCFRFAANRPVRCIARAVIAFRRALRF
jgi:hypothetical protein